MHGTVDEAGEEEQQVGCVLHTAYAYFGSGAADQESIGL
jgi:hypothetical protein